MSRVSRSKKDSEYPHKRCYLIGRTWVVGIDTEIANKLQISEENTVLEQQIVVDGILMKIKKLENSVSTSNKSD